MYDAKPIAVLDFEASGLHDDSYPIEVAWGFASTLEIEHHLIMPAPDWEYWDWMAQEIHGISRAKLFSEGKGGPFICARMLKELAGHDVYADGVEYDQMWMDTLFEAAGLKGQAPVLQHFQMLVSYKGEGVAAEAAEIAARTHPRTHRAGDDVAHMLRVLSLVDAL